MLEADRGIRPVEHGGRALKSEPKQVMRADKTEVRQSGCGLPVCPPQHRSRNCGAGDRPEGATPTGVHSVWWKVFHCQEVTVSREGNTKDAGPRQ